MIAGMLSMAASLLLVFAAGGRAADLPSDVAARVNDRSISVHQVTVLAKQVVGGKLPNAAEQTTVKRETLRRLIDRYVIMHYLTDRDQAASANTVTAARQQFIAQLKRRGVTLNGYLQQQELTESQWRDDIAWKATWQIQLENYLNDTNLQKYFDRHRRQFDGTELQVAHIVLLVKDADQQVQKQAELDRLRLRLVAGEMTFEAAARKVSDAPSADTGGTLGWIGFDGPMAPVFTRAAFTLDVGSISSPIVTPVGVHLIKCLAVRPGKRAWRDARTELRAAVTKYLFDWFAKRGRAGCRIEVNSAIAWAAPLATPTASGQH